MKIIPVLDVMDGKVVRGIGGRRDEYLPIKSNLTSSTAPLDVARAFREHFGATHIYVADLDAITGGKPALAMLEQLQADDFRIWVDAGIRDASDVQPLLAVGVDGIIAGLETLAGSHVIRHLTQQVGSSQIIFSLDLKNGRAMTSNDTWNSSDPRAIAADVVSTGVATIIVLDLARVGVHDGAGTEELCAALVGQHPSVSIIAGGGIRGRADLERLRALGVASVLIASALHDGRLARADVYW